MISKPSSIFIQSLIVMLVGGTVLSPAASLAEAERVKSEQAQDFSSPSYRLFKSSKANVVNVTNPEESANKYLDNLQRLETGSYEDTDLAKFLPAVIAVKEPPKMEDLKVGMEEPPSEEEYWFAITQNRTFDVKAAVMAAYSDVGKSYPTGWSQEGECIMAVKRWLTKGGGATWGEGGTPPGNYTSAKEVPLDQMQAGDVVQYIYTDSPESWVSGIHTILITGNNWDGTYKIVESNNPGGSGLVSSNDKWKPEPPSGFVAKAFRF